MQLTIHHRLQAAAHEVVRRRWRDVSSGPHKTAVHTEHFEGVTLEKVAWYLTNMDNESYKLWHPAHVALEWESKVVGPGATMICWEYTLGHLAAHRKRQTPIEQSPVPVKHPHGALLHACLDTYGEPLGWFLHEFFPRDKGFDIQLTMIYPSGFPNDFIDAQGKHWREEIRGMVHKAVPFLVQKIFGYNAPVEKLREQFFIVPAE